MPTIATDPDIVASQHHAAGSPPNGRCSGCIVTGVPLLACDDPELYADTHAGSKPRFCSNCMIGKKVRVFWPVDNSWYVGVVLQFDASTGEHLLKYDDEDTEWVKIGESNTCAAPSSRGGGRPGSPNVDPESPSAGNHHEHSSSRKGESPRPPGRDPEGGPQERPWSMDRSHPPPHDPVHPYGYGSGGPMYPGGPYGMPGYHVPPGAFQGPPYGYPPVMNMPPGMMGHDGRPAKSPSEPRSSPASMGGSASKRKQGPKAWTKEEDAKLLSIVQSMRMPMKWSIVAQSLPDRTGKQCRERYVNHLNPRLKVTDWSNIEDATIFHLYNTMGSHWAKMSKIIPGRTDNGIKNRFHNLRRQLEREDEHRLRLSAAENFPEEIRLDRQRDFPEKLQGKASELWDMKFGIGVLAAQSVLGGSISRNSGRFGPFRPAEVGDMCVRCGLLMPSLHTGTEVCTKSGWCQSCTRIPAHVCCSLLRECLNLRREQDPKLREIIEQWDEYFARDGSKQVKTEPKAV